MKTKTTLFTQLCTKSSLLDAWRIIRKKGKAGGIDSVSVHYYEKRFNRNLDALLDELKNGRYTPEPYKRIDIKKENKPGEYRPLSLPTVNDKIVQQALRGLLEPIFNPLFLNISYAYRPAKGPAKAIGRIAHIISANKSTYAVCADIDNYFDTLDHQILLAELSKTADEPEITKLVRMWLKIGAVNPKGSYEDTPFGIAQGGVISPLLSNIYLHPLDVYMTEKGYDYVRYADNFILLAANRAKIEETFKAADYFLREVLKLRLNRQKQLFKRLEQGFVFMGIFFKAGDKSISRGRIQRMQSRLRYLVRSKLWHRSQEFFKKMDEAYTRNRFKLIKGLPERFKSEIAGYGDIAQALYQSGVFKPKGLKQLDKIITRLRKRTVIRGGDVYYIAMDTNLLRDRFFSTYLINITPHPNLDYILCSTVRSEMKNRREKFKRKALRSMSSLPQNILNECFINQNGLEDRLRYIGFHEYNRMRDKTGCEELDAPSARSGMKNDQFILEAYSGFVAVGVKVIFISRDNEAVRMMTGEDNVIPILLEHPPMQRKQFKAPWDRFFAFLYLLGVLYGKLHIIVGGVKIAALSGVWKGKDVAEWEEDSARLHLYRPMGGDAEETREFRFMVRRIERSLAILQKI